MKIFIRVKSAGNRRPLLELSEYEVPGSVGTAEELIAAVVRDNVRRYNAKEVDAELFRYLSAGDVKDAAALGKVGFGDRKNDADADEEAAVETAVTAFRDGLFLLLIGDKEVIGDDDFALNEGDVVTFIRLVMLAGRRW
ncbi:MAG: hypothetical protein LBN35_00040 [Clostridiales Family XIII bacterium]|jgi:hypothetical protein|nr:hypothetical protein [Clostridiales Family XIII bacterium]